MHCPAVHALLLQAWSGQSPAVLHSDSEIEKSIFIGGFPEFSNQFALTKSSFK